MPVGLISDVSVVVRLFLSHLLCADIGSKLPLFNGIM